MKQKLYTQTKDDCWRISLCNYFRISPKKMPHFVKLHRNDFVGATRKWLNKRGKTITYVPFDSFLDTGIKYNQNLFPEGKCIAYIGDKEGKVSHACLMIDGELFQEANEKYEKVWGYFIIHNL